MKYFLSAGETSGDLHAAALVRALRRCDPEASFSFLGGDAMAHEAGCDPLIHISRMAYMGFSEVLRHIGDIRANLSLARRAIANLRPDALVLIDYPSFNFKLASEAHRLGVKVFYYIPPKVWAWKEWRVKTLRKYCTEIFSILPFETDFYRRHGMEVQYVGNPSVAEVDSCELYLNAPVASTPIVALVPGSRVGEIRCNLPVMVEAARRLGSGVTPVIAAAPGIDAALYASLAPDVALWRDGSMALMKGAAVALVTSGTATLECALLGTPQVACYRANGSRLSYELMKRLLSVRYVTLPNLIMDEEIIPEMLLHRCTPEAVAAEAAALMPGEPGREPMLREYARMRARLGTADPAATAAEKIFQRIHKQP